MLSFVPLSLILSSLPVYLPCHVNSTGLYPASTLGTLISYLPLRTLYYNRYLPADYGTLTLLIVYFRCNAMHPTDGNYLSNLAYVISFSLKVWRLPGAHHMTHPSLLLLLLHQPCKFP